MITQLVAASMAHYGALAHGPALPKKTLPPLMAKPSRDEFDPGERERDLLRCPF
jgi:hypothetical protein